MRREEFFDILGQIDDRFIIPARRERRVIPWQNYVGVAAALCVLVTGLWILIYMGSTGNSLLPAKPTDPTQVTTAPSDPTEESTESTAPTETEPVEPELTPEQYGMSPKQYYPFRFDGGAPSFRYDIDTSQCKVGLLYVYDTVDNQVLQISDKVLVEEDCFFATQDHLYYRLEEDPSAIIRSDYFGENQTVIYRSDYGRIDGAHYYGTNLEGKIITRENSNRVCMYDIANKTVIVLLERYNIISALYSEDSAYFIAEEKYEGPLIFWVGQTDANGAVDEYLYCIDEWMDRLFLTGEPTKDPQESQPGSSPAIHGYEKLNSNEQIPTNLEGIPVLPIDNRYYSNGFILDSTGQAFLSLHDGKIAWVAANQEEIMVSHGGKDHQVRFVWCSYAGEIGLLSDGAWMEPILGNDRYVSLEIDNYPYLLDLQTMTVSDPLGDFEVDPTAAHIIYAPDARSCIVGINSIYSLVDISAKKMTPLTALTGLVDVDGAHYVNQNTLAVFEVFDRDAHERYANGYLYNIQSGTVSVLYEDERFDYLRDIGGIEHFGGMYMNFKDKCYQVTDCLTGKQSPTQIYYAINFRSCGVDRILVTAMADQYASGTIWCLVGADGMVMPMSVSDTNTLAGDLLDSFTPPEILPGVHTSA